MKHISRKIILSVGVLCLAIVAFATTTFAWFSLATTGRVNDFTMTIQTDSNLGVRATIAGDTQAVEYASVINLNQDSLNLKKNQLYPIVYSTATSNFKKFSKTHTTTPVVGTVGTDGVGFIQVKLDFQANASGTVIVNSIGSSSTNVAFTSATNISLINGGSPVTITAGTPITQLLACNALRTSFYSADTAGNITASPAFNFINHSGAGEGDYGTDTTNTAITYYNLTNKLEGSNKIKLEAGEQVTSTLKTVYKEDGATLTGSDLPTSQTQASKILTLTKADSDSTVEGTVFVRIWIDGWDADCFNAIMLQKIVMNMSFEFIPKTV